LAVVMAVTDPARGSKGISAFVLERGMPGFSAGRPYRKLGLHASNTAELVFDNVAVPGANLLGELNMGFVNTMQVLEGGRIAMAAMAVGIAQAALDQPLVYMKQRRAFGKTLAELNALQGMIADIGTEVEAARRRALGHAPVPAASVPYEGRDRAAPIPLTRPDVLHGLHNHLVAPLAADAESAAKAPDVWVVVVRGRGRSFCSGIDRKALSAGRIGES